MKITPDQYIVWQDGFFKINHTILFTWFIMIVMIIVALILRVVLTHEKNIGKIKPGNKADFCIMSKDLVPLMTIIDGKTVYEKGRC